MDQKPCKWEFLGQTRLEELDLGASSGKEKGMVEEVMEGRRAIKGQINSVVVSQQQAFNLGQSTEKRMEGPKSMCSLYFRGGNNCSFVSILFLCRICMEGGMLGAEVSRDSGYLS